MKQIVDNIDAAFCEAMDLMPRETTWDKYYEIKGRREAVEMMIVAYAKHMFIESNKPRKERTVGRMKVFQKLMMEETAKYMELSDEMEAERLRIG